MPSRKHKPRPAPQSQRRPRSKRLPTLLLVAGTAVAALILLNQMRTLWFTQDDAYISYRYAQNALDGHGLVFNTGERVEGYTNFLWVILLILGAHMGLDFDTTAKILGIASAVGLIALIAFAVRRLWRDHALGDGIIPGITAALILAANGSLAYWAVSGLETPLFAFLAAAGLFAWTVQSRLLIPLLTLAALTRPEGGLLWVIVLTGEGLWGKGWRHAFRLAVIGGLLLLPFAAFKLFYYGSLLPNPFYAKTGLAWEYIRSGIEYTWLYWREYGLYGATALLGAMSAFGVSGRWRVWPFFWVLYTIYITMVGGDVLKAHRFFAPVHAPLVLTAILGAAILARRIVSRLAPPWAAAAVGIVLCAWSYYMPRDSLLSIWGMERGLIQKMATVASYLKQTDPRPFSIAASTIGRLSYDLRGHRVIDMLGLTDSTIARHPESIPGNVSTWRERNFNATYLMEQDPDYILFSTGHKPSAPAERALMLHSRFRQNYYASLYSAPHLGRLLAVHRRKGDYDRPDEVWPTIDLAHDVNQAFNFSMNNMIDSALARIHKVKRDGPGDFSAPDQFVADIYYRQGDPDRALAYTDSALAIDSFSVTAWHIRASIATQKQDSILFDQAIAYISRLAPWLLTASN